MVILQQRAAADGALRQQADDRDPGVLADVSLTVLLIEADHAQTELLCRPEQVIGREQNVLPVDAAFAALLFLRIKYIVKELLINFFHADISNVNICNGTFRTHVVLQSSVRVTLFCHFKIKCIGFPVSGQSH